MPDDHTIRASASANTDLSSRPKSRDFLTQNALALAADGLPVFPCSNKKLPCILRSDGGHGHLDASTDPTEVIRLFSHAGAKLIGVPCGPRSGFDVVDIDPRHDGHVWEEKNLHRLPETRCHRTGSGGRHYVFKHAPGMRNSEGKIAPGVDVRGDGGYVVFPPSAGYSIESDVDPADWPDWLLPVAMPASKTSHVRPDVKPQKRTDQLVYRYQRYVEKLLENVSSAPEGRKHDVLRNTALALGGILAAAGISHADAHAMLIQALPDSVVDWENAKRTAEWGLKEGEGKPWEIPDRPHPNGKDHAPPPAPATEPEPSAGPNPADDPPPPSGKDQPKQEQSKRKRVVNTLALVNYIEANWQSSIRINLFTETMKVSEQFPPTGEPTGKWRQFCEPADQLEATLHFQNNGFARAGKGVVLDALLAVAHRNAFHPVSDYLASLKWDGKLRVRRLFRIYFNAEIPTTNAEETAKKLSYYEHIGQCFMVSAVARIRSPGCKVDNLPVLIGPQGFGKSRAIRALCRDDAWFSDDLSPDLTEKDTKDSLVGKWLVELAEIPHVRKEVERVKAFFSRQTDRYRRAYDRMTNDWPRQCVFMGSSNDLEFIDVTGNRRFWPVEVAGPIDVAPIVRDRDQLWAEAVHMFVAGFECG